jgi:hypothetical protein
MKFLFTLVSGILFTISIIAQNVGIGISNPLPDAILQIDAVNKGLVIPRGNATTLSALKYTTVKGLMYYDTTTNNIWIHNGNGLPSGWMNMEGGSLWQKAGVLGNEIKNTNAGGFWSANGEPVKIITLPKPPPVSGEGTRLMWMPAMSAFRVGTLGDLEGTPENEGNYWNIDSIGPWSFSSGVNTVAKGQNSTSMGYYTKARGAYSVAIGFETEAIGQRSMAFGHGSKAGGSRSIAMGFENLAMESNSMALGVQTISNAFSSMAIGIRNDTTPGVSIIHSVPTDPLLYIGNGNSDGFAGPLTRSNAMVILKNGNIGIGTSTPAATLHVKMAGANIFNGFLVDGSFEIFSAHPNFEAGSRLFYYPAKAVFRAGMVTGSQWDNNNTGFQSTAFGVNTTAMGIATTAMGNNTFAKSAFETATGIWNTDYTPLSGTSFNSADRLFVIGNGTSSGARSDAVVVLKNGNVGIGFSAPSNKLQVNGNTEISGFTRLGESANAAPIVKMKKLSGTSSASQGNWVNVPHGLTASKILAVDILMDVPGFVHVTPAYTFQAQYEYQYQVAATNIVVINMSGNSANILSKAFRVLITYEE